jgi:rhamnogalacturonyl hydrolase YesR
MTSAVRATLAVALLFTLVDDPTARADTADPEILPSGLKPEEVEERSYLDYARQCLDLLIEHGTDRYGKVHTPVLMNILDVRSRTCPENPLPLDEAYRVTRRERRGPAGGNLYADQPTIRALHALGKMTGDARYAAFADECVNYTVTELVDEKGLFWWGWHRHYDAYRDVMTGHAGNHHEIHIQQAIWPELWRVNPRAVTREIEAVWQWHVVDKTTGECNRHADGQHGCDFAMSGGEILLAFAFMHRQTGDQKWLDRARLVADYYWNSRNPQTNLIANRPNAGKDRFDGSHFDTSIPGFHCRSLLAAFELTGEPAFRDRALAYLKAYAKYGYDEKAGQFWGSLALDGTPVPGPRAPAGDYGQYEPRGHIDLWEPYVAGYENPIYAAQAYAYAAEMTGDAEVLQAARRWADAIRREFPPRRCNEETWYGPYAKDWAPHGTYAGLYGRTISFFLHMHRITGETDYLEFARQVARESLSKLYYKGLLRGHPCKPYYESIDGVGYLLYALLQLDEALSGKENGEKITSPLNG